MSLNPFNWLKQKFGKHAAPDNQPFTLSGTVNSKTSDDVFVIVPVRMDVKVADRHTYEHLSFKPKDTAVMMVDSAVRTEVAQMSYEDLLKPDNGISDKVMQSSRKTVRDSTGLELTALHVEKAQGPAMLAELTAQIERSHAEAIEKARAQAKAIVSAHETAKDMMEGLDGEMQIKKPLTLKKAKPG